MPHVVFTLNYLHQQETCVGENTNTHGDQLLFLLSLCTISIAAIALLCTFLSSTCHLQCSYGNYERRL